MSLDFLIKEPENQTDKPKHRYAMPITAEVPGGSLNIGCYDEYCKEVVLWFSTSRGIGDIGVFSSQEAAMMAAEQWLNRERQIINSKSVRYSVPALKWTNDYGIVKK